MSANFYQKKENTNATKGHESWNNYFDSSSSTLHYDIQLLVFLWGSVPCSCLLAFSITFWLSFFFLCFLCWIFGGGCVSVFAMHNLVLSSFHCKLLSLTDKFTFIMYIKKTLLAHICPIHYSSHILAYVHIQYGKSLMCKRTKFF